MLWAQQVKAILTKNFLNQTRSWRSTTTLFLVPLVLLLLVWGMQRLIDDQFDSRAFRCGCKCTSCCSWTSTTSDGGGTQSTWQCREDTPQQPCTPAAQCQAYNDSRCGYEYSTPSQIAYCKVEDPPVWPPVMQVPSPGARVGRLNTSDEGSIVPVRVPYTGNEQQVAAAIMELLIPPQPDLSQQLLQAARTLNSSGTVEAVFMERLLTTDFCNISASKDQRASLLVALTNTSSAQPLMSPTLTAQLSWMVSQLQLVLGSSSPTTVTNFIDLSFMPTVSPARSVALRAQSSPLASWTAPAQDAILEPNTLYILAPDCSALSPLQQLLLRQLSCAVNSTLQLMVQCTSLQPEWIGSSQLLQDQLFCGWNNARCTFVDGRRVTTSREESRTPEAVQQYPGAVYQWDFNDSTGCTTQAAADVGCWLQSGVDLTVWVNATITPPNFPPYNDRWPGAVQAAADAFLHSLTGGNWTMSLEGLKGFPFEGGEWKTDFASLMGPLFFMWILNLPLTVFTSSLVAEKQSGLQRMMFASGLSPSAFLAATYIWQLGVYCVYMAVCALFGAAIKLQFFTLNSALIQIILYLLWGSVLTTYCLWTATIWQDSQRAVLAAILTNIMSGLFANLVVLQFVQYGPSWLSHLLEVMPLFALYRGLWELSQYAVLADATRSHGMTLASLRDEGNGMMLVWLIMAVFSIWFGFWAWFRLQGRTLMAADGKLWRWLMSGLRQSCLKVQFIRARCCLTQVEPHTPESSMTHHDDLGSRTSRGHGASFAAEPHSPQPRQRSAASCSSRAEASVQKHPEPADVLHEREKVETLLQKVLKTLPAFREEDGLPFGDALVQQLKAGGQDAGKRQAALKEVMGESKVVLVLHAVVKVYSGQRVSSSGHGAARPAVNGLSLAVRCKECFALLGPNGAGKTTTLQLMQGAIQPTAGVVILGGFDTSQHPSAVRKMSGVCGQHDVLWPHLTGREHLELYGRLKGLPKGALGNAVIQILAQVKLDPVARQPVKTYSGGMRRRLSVANALLGDASVVYLDEPSTGLDPASRLALWEILRAAKQSRALVLTTHSMSEAEALCDRVGIIVGGQLQCLGTPQELMERYSNILLFAITTPLEQEEATIQLVHDMCPSARLVHSMMGTYKFELPKADTNLFHVFSYLEQEACVVSRNSNAIVQLHRNRKQACSDMDPSRSTNCSTRHGTTSEHTSDVVVEDGSRYPLTQMRSHPCCRTPNEFDCFPSGLKRRSIDSQILHWHDAASNMEIQSREGSAVSIDMGGKSARRRCVLHDADQMVGGSNGSWPQASEGCSDSHICGMRGLSAARVVVFDWGVSNTTLEQVFLNVVQQYSK